MTKTSRHPDGWRRCAIGDVATVRFSSVDKKSVAGESPVWLCNYMDVWKNDYIDGHLSFMQATATPREIEQFTLAKHDVLLTKDSETKDEIADPAVVRTDRDDLVLGYHLALVQPDPKKAYGPFVAAQLALPQFRAQFVRVANGATRYGLGIDEIRNGTLLLPAVEEQRAVAEILGAVDDAIDATRRVIEQTRRLKTAVLQDLLTHGLPGRHSEFKRAAWLGSVPQSWKVMTLGRLLREPIKNGYSPLCPKEPTGKWMLTLSAVSRAGFNPRGVKPAPVGDPEVDACRVAVGDILVSRSNTQELVGLAGMYRGSPEQCSYPDLLMRVRLDDARLDPEFGLHVLLSAASRAYFRRASRGTSGSMKKIDRDILEALPIPTAPLDEQRAVIEIMASITARVDNEQSGLESLRRIKSGLSQALLTGRVRVPAATLQGVS